MMQAELMSIGDEPVTNINKKDNRRQAFLCTAFAPLLPAVLTINQL